MVVITADSITTFVVINLCLTYYEELFTIKESCIVVRPPTIHSKYLQE